MRVVAAFRTRPEHRFSHVLPVGSSAEQPCGFDDGMSRVRPLFVARLQYSSLNLSQPRFWCGQPCDDVLCGKGLSREVSPGIFFDVPHYGPLSFCTQRA